MLYIPMCDLQAGIWNGDGIPSVGDNGKFNNGRCGGKIVGDPDLPHRYLHRKEVWMIHV